MLTIRIALWLVIIHSPIGLQFAFFWLTDYCIAGKGTFGQEKALLEKVQTLWEEEEKR